MSILVDTNAWIAFFEDSPMLSDRAATLMESSEEVCFISIASIWESAIKVGLGKLKLPYDFVGGHFKMHHLWSLQSAPLWTGLI